MEFWIKMQKKNHGHNSTQSSFTKKCFVFKRRLIKISVGRPMSHLRSINLKGRSHPKKPPNPVTNFEAAAANSHWQWLNELGNSRVQKMSQWTSWFDCWARANHSTWHLWIPKQNISSAYQYFHSFHSTKSKVTWLFLSKLRTSVNANFFSKCDFFG